MRDFGASRVNSLIVDPDARCWASGREIIDRDPRQDLVISPRIVISPIMQFL